MKKIDKPVVVEQMFQVPIESVWKAITEIDLMRQWYFDNIPAFEAEVGFETSFNVVSNGRDFLHQWKVIEVMPLEKIKYNWKYESYPGDANLSFELFKQNDRTKLVLTLEVLEDFPEEIPEFKRESCVMGWEYFINQRLKIFLDKHV